MKRLFIQSVGLSLAPLLYALDNIENIKPPNDKNIDTSVLFLCSEQSKSFFPELKSRAKELGFSILNNQEPLLINPKSYRDILATLRCFYNKALAQYEFHDVVCDITGGTKPMVAAEAQFVLSTFLPNGVTCYLVYTQAEETGQGTNSLSSTGLVIVRVNPELIYVQKALRSIGNFDFAEAATYFRNVDEEQLIPLREVIFLANDIFGLNFAGALERIRKVEENRSKIDIVSTFLQRLQGSPYAEFTVELVKNIYIKLEFLNIALKTYDLLLNLERCSKLDFARKKEAFLINQIRRGFGKKAYKLAYLFYYIALYLYSTGNKVLASVILYRAVELAFSIKTIIEKGVSPWNFTEFQKLVEANENRKIGATIADYIKLFADDLKDRLHLIEEIRYVRNYSVLIHGFSWTSDEELKLAIGKTFELLSLITFKGNKDKSLNELLTVAFLPNSCLNVFEYLG